MTPRAAFAVTVLLVASLSSAETPVTTFPTPFDSSDWTRLLAKYVDERGLVAYAGWRANPADRKRLDDYLDRFSPAGAASSDAEKVAMLVNAYNAFIARMVLGRYPVDGIRSIPGAFTAEAHLFGGRNHSLDEIEHTAVALGGYRVHATVVCASRSCPPLDRRAYDAASLTQRQDERMSAWMTRPDLFRFEPDRNLAKLSRYFDWYRRDFEKPGIPRVLSTYAPERYRSWLGSGAFRIEYLEYDWSLNDARGH